MELKSPYTYRSSFNRYSSRSNIKRSSNQYDNNFANKNSDKSYSKSRVERSPIGSSSNYMEHLITIKKNLQQADHFITEPATHIHVNEYSNTLQQPSKANWLQRRSFFERNSRQSAHSSRPQLSCHKELINWARLEVELIVQEYRLNGIDLARLESILTFKSLLEYLLELLRRLARKCMKEQFQISSSRSFHKMSSNFEENEMNTLKEENMMLKRSEMGANLKLDEIKNNWKESTNKITKLQSQLEFKQSEMHRLTRICQEKDKSITNLQKQIQNIHTSLFPEQRRAQQINAQLQYLRVQNLRLNEETFNNSRAISRLQRIIIEKDEQYDKLSTDKSKLLQLYLSLEKEKLQISKFYQEELLITVKKLCEERRNQFPMRGSHSHSALHMFSPQQDLQKTQGRNQILDLIVHSLQTLQKRENQYRKERKQIAKSREKLYRESVRTSQQIHTVSKEAKYVNNTSTIQQDTSSFMPLTSNTPYYIQVLRPSQHNFK